MKITTTYRELINFANVASQWTQLIAAEPPTKLSYATARMLKRSDSIISKFSDDLQDLRTDNCLTDEKTHAVLYESGGQQNQYKFTKEGLKAVSVGHQALLDKEVEIEPYFATEVPDGLRNDIRVAFEGFVLKVAEDSVAQ